jgi:hypothetical protein
MAIHFEQYTTTPANWVADTKAKITTSTDWSNITGNIVKATTTRGAEMVVDLNKAAPVNNYATISVFRTHNGSSGTDEVTRYLHWKYNSSGTTSNTLHCLVSASKEHLVLQVEGPYGTESNYDNIDAGSKRSTFVIADIVPYHGGDTVATVGMWANTANSQSTVGGNHFLAVSRDQGNSESWVPASIGTVHPIMSTEQSTYAAHLFQHVAKGDGKTYLFPYVVIETADGLRGRLNNVYWAGWSKANASSGAEAPGLAEGNIVTYSSADYLIRKFTRSIPVSSSQTVGPFGGVPQSSSFEYAPLIAIKKT